MTTHHQEPRICVLETREVPGCQDVLDASQVGRGSEGSYDPAAGVPLSEALEAEWTSDSHLTLYRLQRGLKPQFRCPIEHPGELGFLRLNKGVETSVQQAEFSIGITILAFDYDLTDSTGRKTRWNSAGEVAQWMTFFLTLPETLPKPTWFYTTKHGFRIVYELDRPLSCDDAEALYAQLDETWRQADVAFDESCGQWNRLFRLPKTRREGEKAGEEFWRSSLFVLNRVSAEPLRTTKWFRPTTQAVPLSIASATQVPEGDYPMPEDYQYLFVEELDGGKRRDSKFIKAARRKLNNKPIGEVVFGERKLTDMESWNNSEWDTSLLSTVSALIALCYECPNACPEGLFGLIHGALEQLNADDQEHSHRDWCEDGWDKLCRTWAKHVTNNGAPGRMNGLVPTQDVRMTREGAEDAFQARVASAFGEGAAQLTNEQKEAIDDGVRRSLILTHGKRRWFRKLDGQYVEGPPLASIPQAIVSLGLETLFELDAWSGNTMKLKSDRDLLREYSLSVHQLIPELGRSVVELDVIDQDASPVYRLLLPAYNLDPRLEPKFDVECDEYLRILAGTRYERLADCLAAALYPVRPTAAVELRGASGAGKNMIVSAVAQCFAERREAKDSSFAKFNAALAKTCVIHFEEGAPEVGKDVRLLNKFRQMVSGGEIEVTEKGVDTESLECFPRIWISTNNIFMDELLASSRGQLLTEDDIRAIEARLVVIEASQDAADWLSRKGSREFTYDWTAKKHMPPGRLSQHIMWLHTQRIARLLQNRDRFLVQGDVDSTDVRAWRTNSSDVQRVLTSIEAAVRLGMSGDQSLVWWDGLGGIWTTPGKLKGVVILDGDDSASRMSHKAISKAMAAIGFDEPKSNGRKVVPPGLNSSNRARWRRISHGQLHDMFEDSQRETDVIDRLQWSTTAEVLGTDE